MDNKWIPVTKDMLPPLGEWVLIWDSYQKKCFLARLDRHLEYFLTGRKPPLVWEIEDNLFYDVFAGEHDLTQSIAITHWCRIEIPPPPRKE